MNSPSMPRPTSPTEWQCLGSLGAARREGKRFEGNSMATTADGRAGTFPTVPAPGQRAPELLRLFLRAPVQRPKERPARGAQEAWPCATAGLQAQLNPARKVVLAARQGFNAPLRTISKWRKERAEPCARETQGPAAENCPLYEQALPQRSLSRTPLPQTVPLRIENASCATLAT